MLKLVFRVSFFFSSGNLSTQSRIRSQKKLMLAHYMRWLIVLHCDKVSGSDGKQVIMRRGDGKKAGKGLKCEWATVKDGLLYVGSTGKERTNSDGSIAHMGELWVRGRQPFWPNQDMSDSLRVLEFQS